ncbi:epimerase family protein SDR39U1 [Copidosoma floridanum]|uniref:epimerase family protein SDR39U1 n=1 Tax=Copidosoma floridanum TaxID=29053 RepID=UPI0006C9D341|nr:epimerase family protein SDR39U1 [Copidosoma floridanum]
MALKHVIIGGGTGYIGSCIATALSTLKPPLSVRTTIISRMPGPNRMSWQELEINGLPKDTTAVINVAGQNILDFTQRWTPGFKQNVYNSRVKTTKQLAEAISNSDVKTFITISGVAYYPPDRNEYTEYDQCKKYDFLSELCHDWECAAELPKDSSTRQITIRSGVVLGRTGGMIKQVIMPFFFGLGGPIGSGTQYMPWIHIRDLVNLFLHALQNECVRGIYNGVAPELVTNAEFTKAFASALGRPAFIPLPEFALKTLLNEERAKIMLEGQKVIPKRVLESNFQYKYPTIKRACEEFAWVRYEEPY